MIDPDLLTMLRTAEGGPPPDLCDLPLPAARAVYEQIMAAADRPAADVHVRDAGAVGAEGGPAVALRIYQPRDAAAGALPLVLYLHGGGYILGSLDGYDRVCRQLCADMQAIVVSVGYRLAPEHPWPAPVLDAQAAALWVSTHARALGADPDRLALAGDSAGAVLAFSIALDARRRAAARPAGSLRWRVMALLYPPAAGGHPGDFPSHRLHAAGPTLTLRTMEHFGRQAFGPEAMAPDEHGAPLLCADARGLPPVVLLLAGLDPLLDEGRTLAAKLGAQGHPVQVVEFSGLPHGFIAMAGRVRMARQAQRMMAELLSAHLSGAPTGPAG